MKGFIELVISPDEVLEVESTQHNIFNVDVIQGIFHYGNKVGFDVASNLNTTTLTFNSQESAFEFYCEIFEKLEEATK